MNLFMLRSSEKMHVDNSHSMCDHVWYENENKVERVWENEFYLQRLHGVKTLQFFVVDFILSQLIYEIEWE